MKRLLTLPLALFALTLLAAAFWPDTEAVARPCQEVSCDYYSNASYTQIVGHSETTCIGVFYTGTQTQWVQCVTGELCAHCGGCVPPTCPY